MRLVHTAFLGASNVLRTTANSLDQFKGDLPDGVTRGAPTEQFSVTYSVDLSKMKMSSRNGSDNNTETVTTSVLALIGAGANADMAVLAMGMDASGSGKLGSGRVRAQFTASANQKDMVLKVNLNGNENITAKTDGSNQTENVHGTHSVDLMLDAVEKPRIGLGVTGKFNGLPVEGGTFRLTNEDHTIAAAVKVEAAENNGISATYSYTMDEKKTDGILTMVTDKHGQCVVKDSTVTGPSSLAAR